MTGDIEVSRQQVKTTKFITNHLAGIGVIILFTGFFLLYLALYGDNVSYTHTYYYVTKLVPPAINMDLLMVGILTVVVHLLFVFTSAAKGGLVRWLQDRPKARIVIAVLGTLIFLIALALLVALVVLPSPLIVALSKLEQFILYLIPGSFGLLALFFAAFPKFILLIGVGQPRLVYRLGAFVIAVIMALFVISMIELQLMDPPDQQVLASQSGTTPSSANATHYLFFTVKPHYRKLLPKQSVPIEVIFKAIDPSAMGSGVTGAYPVALDPNHEYAVKVNFRGIGFEAQSPPEEFLQPRPIVPNEPLKWQWIIAPKEGTEGTDQTIIFDAFIYDLTNNSLVAESPFNTVSIKITTPLGFPKWLVSPQTGIGTIIGGAIAIGVPWALGEVSAVRKEQREETRRKRERKTSKSPWWRF